MVCVLDNLRFCEKCDECEEIRQELGGGCVLDGCMCQGCGECNRIRECCDWREV